MSVHCPPIGCVVVLAAICGSAMTSAAAGDGGRGTGGVVEAHFILYVADQPRAAAFYRRVLDAEPRLDVPGMTQFEMPGGSIVGLMPAAGIKRLLGDPLPDPAAAVGVPRAELYLVVGDPEAYLARALAAGATTLSPVELRGWGDRAGYCLDPDGHVLAFAGRDPGGEIGK